jgi:hypothetical protein
MINGPVLANNSKFIFLLLDGLGDITASIGTIYSKQLMSLALAHALKLDKCGA